MPWHLYERERFRTDAMGSFTRFLMQTSGGLPYCYVRHAANLICRVSPAAGWSSYRALNRCLVTPCCPFYFYPRRVYLVRRASR